MPDLKPELSGKSQYWISKHRYYELKHYCLQYPEWKKLRDSLDIKMETVKLGNVYGTEPSDPTAKLAQMRVDLDRAIDRLLQISFEASEELGGFIFMAVTEGLSFTQLKTVYNIPCGKDMYYDSYRKFFWMLSQSKGI